MKTGKRDFYNDDDDDDDDEKERRDNKNIVECINFSLSSLFLSEVRRNLFTHTRCLLFSLRDDEDEDASWILSSIEWKRGSCEKFPLFADWKKIGVE